MYFIFLPAYNEERDIRTLLLRIHDAMQGIGLDYKVIVVNDGSTDGTAVFRYGLKSGQNKMKVIRTILRYFVLISRNLFSRHSPLTGKLV